MIWSPVGEMSERCHISPTRGWTKIGERTLTHARLAIGQTTALALRAIVTAIGVQESLKKCWKTSPAPQDPVSSAHPPQGCPQEHFPLPR